MPKLSFTIHFNGTFPTRADEVAFLRELQDQGDKLVRRITKNYPNVRDVKITGGTVEPD